MLKQFISPIDILLYIMTLLQTKIIVLSSLIGGFSFLFCFFTIYFYNFKSLTGLKPKNIGFKSFLIPFSVITPERSWGAWAYDWTIGWLVSKPPLFPIEPVLTSRTWAEYFSSIFYGQKPSGVVKVAEVINREDFDEFHYLLNRFIHRQECISERVWLNITSSKCIIGHIEKIFCDLNLFKEGQQRNNAPLISNLELDLLRYKARIGSTQDLVEFNSIYAKPLKDHGLLDMDTKKIILSMELNAKHFTDDRKEYIQLVEQTSLQYKNLTDCMEAFEKVKNSHFTYLDEDAILWNETIMINLLKKAEVFKINLEECLKFWELSVLKNGSNLFESYSLVRSLISRTSQIINVLNNPVEIVQVAAFETPMFSYAWLWPLIGKGVLVLVGITTSIFFSPFLFKSIYHTLPAIGVNSFFKGGDLNRLETGYITDRVALLTSANEKVIVWQWQSIYSFLIVFTFLFLVFFFYFILKPFFSSYF